MAKYSFEFKRQVVKDYLEGEGSYNYIAQKYGDDNDPLDVIVICSEQVFPGSLIRCYPIGMLNMVDDGENDQKIIAIPFNDPNYNMCKSLEDLPTHIFEEIKHFFSVYKSLEHKDTTVDEIFGLEEAQQVIDYAMANYVDHFGE